MTVSEIIAEPIRVTGMIRKENDILETCIPGHT
jgi:hypothetical protein